MRVVKRALVRYKVKPGRAEENEELVRAVFSELRALQPAGLSYATFKLADGLTFVHVASYASEEDRHPLLELSAFKQFQAAIRERCEEQPTVSGCELIGAYGSLS